MIVNRNELSDVLGISLSAIDNRIKKGLPVESKGREGKSYEFDTAKVINWHVEQAKEKASRGTGEDRSITEAKRRKLNAEADKAELELAKELGLVVMIDDVMPGYENALANLRSQLLNLPRRVTPLILGETDETTVKTILEDELNRILEEIHEQAIKDLEELKDE